MPTRREFLSSATLTLLAIPLADCSSHKSKQSASTLTDASGDDGALADASASPEAAPPDAAEAASDAAVDGEAGACGALETSTAVPDPQVNDQTHTHTLCVPQADLANPPGGGATYTTSTELGHSHTVTVAVTDLQDIAGSSTVTLTVALAHDHEHAFIINE